MSGAEIAGVSLGVAAILPPLMTGSYENIFKPLLDYKNAPQVVRDFEAFGADLHRGKLRMNIAVAIEAFDLIWVDDATKTALRRSLQALDQEIRDAAPILQDLKDSSGAPKSSFHIRGRRRAMDALGKLKKRQEECETLLRLVETRKKLVTEDAVLPRDKFRLFKDRPVVRVPGRTDLYVGEGEHKSFYSNDQFLYGNVQYDGQSPAELYVLVERKPNQLFDDALASNAKFMGEWKQAVEKIASKLKHFSPAPCILRCLGYIDHPIQGLQLISHIPPFLRLESAVTLAERIHDTRRRKEFPSMHSRLQICRKVASGVCSLQASKMVHKSLRPDNILLFENVSSADEPQSDTVGAGVSEPSWEAFFIGWDTLRGSTSVSSRGDGSGLMERFYTHPQRLQSRKPSYHYGHEVYSLAIVMLEILAWNTFVIGFVIGEDEERLSDLYPRSASLSSAAFSDAEMVQRTLSSMVRQQIVNVQESDLRTQGDTGQKGLAGVYSFVEVCLDCVEKGLPPRITADNWRKDHGLVALAFLDKVKKTFDVEDMSQP